MLEKGNDLNAETATLNYKSLLSTAESAVVCLLQDVDHYKLELKKSYHDKYPTGIEINAKRMRDKTLELIDATEVLAVLYGSEDRDILQITGRANEGK